MSQKKICVFVVLIMIGLSACSNKEMYKSLKKREEVLCNQVPASEYEECMKNAEGDYDKYKEQRNEIIK